MPDLLQPETLGVLFITVVAIAGATLWVRAHRKKQPTPEQFEANRRQWLSTYGKLSGGEILELQEQSLSYCYDVRGVNYTAFQDISALAGYLPEDRWSIIGGVGVRYDPRNPANSIVLCETWSGLRRREPSSS